MEKVNIFLDNDSIIHISGSLNFYNCMDFKKKCALYTKKLNKISIDLRHLRSNDSSIILLIINIIRTSKPKRVVFINVSESIKKLLKSYKIDYIFSKYLTS